MRRIALVSVVVLFAGACTSSTQLPVAPGIVVVSTADTTGQPLADPGAR